MGSLPVDTLRPLDPDTFAADSAAIVDFLAGYYRDVDKYPVRAADLEPGRLRKLLPEAAPEWGEPMERILDDVRRDVLPGLTHWQSPSFFAYFPMNASAAGFAGEMLSVGLNVVPFVWVASPAAAELEGVVVDWMASLVGLPERFLFSGGGGGVLQGSTCEAVVCTLAAARDRALGRIGHEGIMKLVVYASDQTHATFQKGARLVGIPPANFRVIRTTAASGYALAAGAVSAAVEDDVAHGLVPLYLCATMGTTGLGAVDPVRELGEVARRHGMWLHVDAAYAGSAAICPEYQGYLDGAELADSVSMNPHKWFLTNMDCCCLWVASPAALNAALSTDPEYLKNVVVAGAGGKPQAAAIDYKDWQISLSRRFRAMKLWFVLRRYGAGGMRAYIRRHVAMAEWFERAVNADERFEVVAPRRFSLVCFRLRQPPRPSSEQSDDDDVNRELLAAVNASGQAFMTHFVVDGKFVIRLAVGGAMTEMRHVRDVWELVQRTAEQLLQRQ
ncbi:hypothetical protein E2562_013463 [Oryza meyeriana var. granulata]|uniref:Tyrosine decarboxylase n=1 Tax=Oryza meyeriana var. granulata TaxID=110450 RepID=A0A6G1BWK5_9ORYZ|nr:hypothetical protein E2562_013463 [Oryza meyeriana var. granulata]